MVWPRQRGVGSPASAVDISRHDRGRASIANQRQRRRCPLKRRSSMDINHWGVRVNDQDHLVFGGCDLVELAACYGTPVHVVDEQRLRGNYRAFARAFGVTYPRVRVFYSYKTNCVAELLAILHEEGCGAEVTSPYELWLASHLGVTPADIIYNGVNKSTDDLQRAVDLGVGLINIDSAPEARRLMSSAASLKRRVDVGVRLDPRVGWSAHFGLQPDADSLLAVANELRQT